MFVGIKLGFSRPKWFSLFAADLSSCITDKAQALAKVVEFPNLEQLSAESLVNVDDPFIWQLMCHCTRLAKLQFAGCWKFSDMGLRFIAEKCPHLEYLDVSACPLVSDEGMDNFINVHWNLPNCQRNQQLKIYWHKAPFTVWRLLHPLPLGCDFLVDAVTFWGPECHHTMHTLRRPKDFTAISVDGESTQSTVTEEQSGGELQIFSDCDVLALTSEDSSGDD